MLRRSYPVLDALSNRWETATMLNTGGTPRINNSPQHIVYERKKKAYVLADNMALRRQRIMNYREWQTVPVLYDMVDDGKQLYHQDMSAEQTVARHRDGVAARRYLKQKEYKEERRQAWERETATA